MQDKVNDKYRLCPGNRFCRDTAFEVESDGDRQFSGYFVSPQDTRCSPISAYAHLSVEFKPDGPDYDPFSHLPANSKFAANMHEVVFQDLLTNAKSVHYYQFRTALFTLFVNGDAFRIIRWDPSGLIVTESVNYLRNVDGTWALLRCLYAFSKLTKEQQGYDCNAVRLSKSSCGWHRMGTLAQHRSEDLDHTERIVSDRAWVHGVFRDPALLAAYGEQSTGALRQLVLRNPTLFPPPGWDWALTDVRVMPVMRYIREAFRNSVLARHPRYRIKVRGKDYLVCKPIDFKSDLVGKGTRAYIALEWHTQRLVFLKDMWTPCYEGFECEGAIIAKLNAHGVPNVPTVIAHENVHYLQGDAGPQVTEASCYSSKSKKKKTVKDLPSVANPVERGASAAPRRRLLHRINPKFPLQMANSAATFIRAHPKSGCERQYPVSVTFMEQVRLEAPDI